MSEEIPRGVQMLLVSTQEEAEEFMPKTCPNCGSPRLSVTLNQLSMEPMFARFECGSSHNSWHLITSDRCLRFSHVEAQHQAIEDIAKRLVETGRVSTKGTAALDAAYAVLNNVTADEQLIGEFLLKAGVTSDPEAILNLGPVPPEQQHGTIVLEIPDADEEEK